MFKFFISVQIYFQTHPAPFTKYMDKKNCVATEKWDQQELAGSAPTQCVLGERRGKNLEKISIAHISN